MLLRRVWLGSGLGLMESFFANGAFMPSCDQDWVEYYLKGYRKSKKIKKQNKE